MQQGAQIHALSHLGNASDRPQEQALQLPADDAPCAICALLAGGSNALASNNAGVASLPVAATAPWVTLASPALSSPSYYQSRAPPASIG